MTSLLSFTSHSSTPKPKIHVSHGTLPPFIDPGQPPTKRSPWRQIHETPFVQSLTITLPASLYDAIFPDLATSPALPPSTASTSTNSTPLLLHPQYHKLIQPLSTLLSSPFLTTIKTANPLILSEGDPTTAPFTYHLLDGTLHISMARDTYERAGLQGHPTPGNGGAQKHTRNRHTVTLDLRAPAMLPGKNGFERLSRAASGVLGDSLVWLLRDLGPGGPGDTGILSHHTPTSTAVTTTVTATPRVQTLPGVHVPRIVTATPVPRLSPFEDDYHELLEWLDLACLHSSQITSALPAPDPYISRYRPPSPGPAPGETQEITTVTWTGLLDRAWCAAVLVEVVRRSRRAGGGGGEQWLAFSARAHRTGRGDGYTVLLNSRDTGAEEEEREGLNGEGMRGGGLQRFTCFQFVDTVTVA